MFSDIILALKKKKASRMATMIPSYVKVDFRNFC